mgnify:CR=1 FL=1
MHADLTARDQLQPGLVLREERRTSPTETHAHTHTHTRIILYMLHHCYYNMLHIVYRPVCVEGGDEQSGSVKLSDCSGCTVRRSVIAIYTKDEGQQIMWILSHIQNRPPK